MIHEAMLCLESLVSVLRAKRKEAYEQVAWIQAVKALSSVEKSLTQFFLGKYFLLVLIFFMAFNECLNHCELEKQAEGLNFLCPLLKLFASLFLM